MKLFNCKRCAPASTYMYYFIIYKVLKFYIVGLASVKAVEVLYRLVCTFIFLFLFLSAQGS